MNVLDTYALIEIKKGNPKYAKIILESFIIPDSTIAELFVVLMKHEGEEEARVWYRKLSMYCAAISKEIMIKALKFREVNKKENISIFDAFGYIYARENGFKFVTGDRAFKTKEGVDYIK
jgi:predicted nucleic acid-binding protein